MIRRVVGALRVVTARIRPVWSGVYRSYRDVPARGPGFNGDEWVAATRARTMTILRQRQYTALPAGDRALLPMLAATVASQQGEVSVLDFGGGMGIGYADVRRAFRCQARVTYVVVETEHVCAEGRLLFADDERIRFVSTLADAGVNIDIVYVNSALQYIEDYPRLLHDLASVGAAYLLFVNTSTGDIPTYATAQRNVPGSTLPYWFVNLEEFTALLHEDGYALLVDVGSERRLAGFAVPRRYRIERGRNLLFARKEVVGDQLMGSVQP